MISQLHWWRVGIGAFVLGGIYACGTAEFDHDDGKPIVPPGAVTPTGAGTGTPTGTGTGTGCGWNGCSGDAPEGAYDCNDGQGSRRLLQCIGGVWHEVVDCARTFNSGGYYCECFGGCGMTETSCMSAFEVCEGYQYDTCGPNAWLQQSPWACVPN